MAIPAEKLKGRVKALYPNANLSTSRISTIADRLCKKPADEASDLEIDEIIKDYNDNGPMTFEEIAKADDTVRSLQAKIKPEIKEEVKKEEINPETDPMKLMLKAITDLTAKVGSLEAEKQKESITSKFANDERVKNIPAFMRKGFTPTSAEDYEENVEALLAEVKPFMEKHKLSGFDGADNPTASQDDSQKKGAVKTKSADEVKDLANSI